jgi:hypothetical protein
MFHRLSEQSGSPRVALLGQDEAVQGVIDDLVENMDTADKPAEVAGIAITPTVVTSLASYFIAGVGKS